MDELIKAICSEIASERENVPSNYNEILKELCFKIVALETQHSIQQMSINDKIEEALKEESEKLTEFRI